MFMRMRKRACGLANWEWLVHKKAIVLVRSSRMGRKARARLLLLLLGALALVLITAYVTIKLETHRQVAVFVSSQSHKSASFQWASENGLHSEVNVQASKRPSAVFNIFSRENRQLKVPGIGSLEMNQEIRDFFDKVVFSNKTHTPPSQPKSKITWRMPQTNIDQHDMEKLMQVIKKLNKEIGFNEDGMLVVNNSEMELYYDTGNSNFDKNGVVSISHGKKHSLRSPLTQPLQKSYILALDFWDQKISGLRNLLSLQCWAAHLGHNIEVVEPVVVGSEFGTLPVYDSVSAPLMFGALYNRSVWNREAPKYSQAKLAQLAEWNKFIKTASPSVILVTLFYADIPSDDCPMHKLNERTRGLILTYDMEIISEVCINLKEVGHMTTTEFDALVFGSHDINDTDVTVIFSQWRGVVNKEGVRLCLVDSPCGQGLGFSHFTSYLRPNMDIIADANTFIGLHYPNGVFFAVIIHMEKILTSSSEGESTKLDVMKKCYVKILHDWSSLVKDTKTNSTFLSMDFNVYGTSVFSIHYFEPIYANLSAMSEQVTHKLLGRNMTMEKWEETLDTVASMDDPAYISLMQTAIAMKSRCIILAGGGPLLDYVLQLYKRAHPKREERCYIQLSQYCIQTAHVVPKSLASQHASYRPAESK